jgi:chromosome partitioning protein
LKDLKPKGKEIKYMATVIALANQKGGVAKTTTCANLGAGLALKGFKTLLIDFDPQANLSQFFGIMTNGQPYPNVGDWIMDKSPAEQTIQKTAFQNLDIIPSNEVLKGVEMDMQKDIFKAFRYLSRKIEAIKDRYDYILIDTLPSFSLLFVNSIAACDYVLVPVKLEYLSMQGLSLLNAKIQDVRDNIKPVQLLGIIGTFFRKGVKESENCLDELKKSVPQHLLDGLIHLNSKLAESAAHSKPIQHYDRNCQGFTDYQMLVEEVVTRCQTTSQNQYAETR